MVTSHLKTHQQPVETWMAHFGYGQALKAASAMCGRYDRSNRFIIYKAIEAEVGHTGLLQPFLKFA